jgi:biotin synthase
MAAFRFINPYAMIRYAGGRNALKKKQKLGLSSGINAALVGNYLTTVGNKIPDDKNMISDEGFEF